MHTLRLTAKPATTRTPLCLQKKSKACCHGKNACQACQACQLTRSPYADTSSRCKRKRCPTFFCLQKRTKQPVVATMTPPNEPAVVDDELPSRLHANADFAQPPVCLQEKHDATSASTTAAHDCKHRSNTGKRKRNRKHAGPLNAAPAGHLLWEQKRTASPVRQAQNRLGCGKTPVYPQDGMCRRRALHASRFFVPDRYSADTGLFQHIGIGVNR